MLGHSVLLRPIYFNTGRKAANNNKRKRERKYSGLAGVLGIKKTESHLVVRDLVLAVM